MSHHSFGVETVFLRARRWILGACALFLFFLAFVSGAAAATLQVATDGADSGDCQAEPCLTIQYAIGQSSAGDVIEVGPGEFAASLASDRIVLDEAVTLAGAQAGVDARDRDVPPSEETVIVGGNYSGGAIRLASAGAVLDGVTVRGHEHSAIQTMIGASGYTIRNSIVTDNDHGIDLETVAADDASPTLIERNRFEANNRPGLMSGIYGDGTITSATIRDNLFTGHTNVPLNVAAPTNAVRRDLAITGNEFINERHMIVSAATGVDVLHNTYREGRSRAISIQGGVSDLLLEGNEIVGGIEAGILFADRHNEGPNTDARILGNSISEVRAGTGGTPVSSGAAVMLAEEAGVPGYAGTLEVEENRLVDNTGGAVRNDLTAAGSTVEAPNNWWGCNGGPGTVGCDSVSGAVDASPWVEMSVRAEPARLVAGGSAAITAAFNRNSAGQPVALSVLEGRPVSFASNRGSVDPESGVVVAGSAQSQFTSGDAVGQVTVAAGFDGEVEGAELFVGSVPAVASATLSGSGLVGEPLTCSPGEVTGSPAPDQTIAWLRDGDVISGQSGTVYETRGVDAGSAITCRVTATNEFGNASAESDPVRVTRPPQPPKPPVIAPKKQVTVPRSGRVVVAAVRCPEGGCRIAAPKRVRVRIRGRVYVARVKAPARIGKGKTGKVRIVLPPRARKAIRGTRTRARVKITVTSGDKRRVVNRAFVLRGNRR